MTCKKVFDLNPLKLVKFSIGRIRWDDDVIFDESLEVGGSLIGCAFKGVRKHRQGNSFTPSSRHLLRAEKILLTLFFREKFIPFKLKILILSILETVSKSKF